MKKIRLVCLTLFMILSCILCCSCRIISLEEVLPSEEDMGQPEGLWLYKSEFRSRTDGSEKQNMLSDVEFGGKKYATDDIEVQRCEYFTDLHRIFFYLTVAKTQDYYCFYNYENKTAKVYESEKAQYDYVTILRSDSTIYLRYENKKGYLYNANGDLLAEGVYDSLIHDTLHGLTQNQQPRQYQWWDGAYHAVALPTVYSCEKYIVTRETLYLFSSYKIIAVNRQREEATSLNELEGERFRYVHADDEGSLYVFGTSVEKREGDCDVCRHRFYKIKGDAVTLISTFERASYLCSGSVVDDKIYIMLSNCDDDNFRYFCYDMNCEKINRIFASTYQEAPTPSTRPEKKVNGYEFYVTSKLYNVSNALLDRKACFYLNRKGPDGNFIMQFSLESSQFFDDICDF